MGKAVIDLPDPLESISPGGSSSVDDLLAQMAGEEIDRLLSEADDPHEKPEPAAVHAEVAAPVIPPRANENISSASTDFPAAIHSSAGDKFIPTERAVTDDLRVLSERPFDEGATGAPQVRQTHTGDAKATTPDERSGLEMPAHDAELETFAMLSDAPDTSLPIYLRPLEWLSAPLEICPDALRELIGKIALLTTFNAIAVLLYVLIFRKR